MPDDLIKQLMLIYAWHLPGGPTPKVKKPSVHKACKEAAEALAAKDAEIAAVTKRTIPRLQSELSTAQERHVEALAEAARLKALLDEAGKVLERCAVIVDRNLYRQREKVEDVPKIARAMLDRLGGRNVD